MTQLSQSSMKTLKSCQQKYFYKKVEKAPVDEDYQEADSLGFGKAFHKVLEDSLHTAASEKAIIAAMEEFGVDKEDKMLLTYMLQNYLKLHKASGLKVVKCELQISTPQFVGYVDFIAQDVDGWWLGDNKTASRHDPSIVSRLHRDYQINLYAYFAEEIGKALDLKGEFKGFRYRQSIKSKAKTVSGLMGGTPTYDIVIEASALEPQKAWSEFLEDQKLAVSLHEGEAPTRNYSACNDYFRPCEYFSRCHGNLASKPNPSVFIHTIETLETEDLLG